MRLLRLTVAVMGAALFFAAPAIAAATHSLYVTNQASNDVSAYSIAAGGGLTPTAGSPFAAGTEPRGVAVTPDGAHLYVDDLLANAVSAYSIAADGTLTPVAGSPFAAGTHPVSVAVSPDGAHLYVANQGSNTVSAYAIAADGSLTQVSGSPFSAGTVPEGVAVSPDGAHLYLANSASNNVSAYAINADGSLTAITGSPFAAGSSPEGVAVSPDGAYLYVANLTSNNVSAYAINAVTGALTQLSGSPFVAGSSPFGVALSPDGGFLYVGNNGDNTVSAYAIDIVTGALTPVAGSPFATGNNPIALAATPGSANLYVTNRVDNTVFAYAINNFTGALTPVASSPFATGTSPVGVAVRPDQGPVAAFSATTASLGSPTSFDASASSDSDGSVSTYFWDFGDGSTQTAGSATTTHTYASAGLHTVTLTVTDDGGCSTKQTFTGQTMSCNGDSAARISHQVTVSSTTNCAGLQAALDAANTGDTIILDQLCTVANSGGSAGIFSLSNGSTDSRSYTLEGQAGSGAGFDGTGAAGRMLSATGASTAPATLTLRNLIFENGSEPSSGGAVAFQGEYSATFDQDTFTNNQAPSGPGGAVDVETSAPSATVTISNSTFTDNQAPSGGPGLGGAVDIINFGASGTVTLDGDSFSGNQAGVGGGAVELTSGATSGSLAVSNSTFQNNTAHTDTGGAIDLCECGAPVPVTLDSNTFSGNQVASPGGFGGTLAGGAVFLDNSAGGNAALTQTGNTFSGNSLTGGNGDATGGAEATAGFTMSSTSDIFTGNSLRAPASGQVSQGAALSLQNDCSAPVPQHSVTNAAIAGNMIGDGGTAANARGAVNVNCVSSTSNPNRIALTNTTVSGNKGGGGTAGIWGDPTNQLVARNSIVVGNTDGAELTGFSSGGGSITASFSDLCNGTAPAPGTGNICADPKLADPANGDVHETAASPTVDVGSNALVPFGLTKDVYGATRIQPRNLGGPAIVDMGAAELPSVSATPTISTKASGGIAVGGSIHDTATLAKGTSPTGTITFALYGPNNSTCSGAPIFAVVTPISGNGTYTSKTFKPTSPGTYRWIATYNGDGHNNAVQTSCSDTKESVVVSKASPALATTASAGLVVGGAIHDTASLTSGVSPTGTIIFKLYGPNDVNCSRGAVFSSSKAVSGNGSYPSAAFTPTQTGVYRWTASYSGDASNNSVTKACNGLNESVTVRPAGPMLTTTASAGIVVGGSVRDTAALTKGQSPTGTITFKLFSDATCNAAPVFTTRKSVTGNGSYPSATFTPTSTGTYRWTASYSGDRNNDPASSPCNAGRESVVVSKATPTLSAKAIANVARSTRAEGTVAGAYKPGGIMTFALYGPNTDCTGTPIFIARAAVSGNGAYESASFAPTKAGSYRWSVSYSGDGNNAAATAPCTSAAFSICVIPNVKGLTLAAARQKIEAASCSVGGSIGHHFSRRVRKGRVLWQRWTPPGTERPGGTPIHLVLSKGRRPS